MITLSKCTNLKEVGYDCVKFLVFLPRF